MEEVWSFWSPLERLLEPSGLSLSLQSNPCRDGFRQKVPKTGALSFQGLYASVGTLPEAMSHPPNPSS